MRTREKNDPLQKRDSWNESSSLSMPSLRVRQILKDASRFFVLVIGDSCRFQDTRKTGCLQVLDRFFRLFKDSSRFGGRKTML